MDKEELRQRYELAGSKTYQDIRTRLLDYIVRQSKTQLSEGNLKGMLMLLAETDRWISEYNTALNKRKEE